MLSVEPSNKEVKVKSPSYYAIRCGYKTGVVQSWDECSKMTNGYPNAEFKSFTNAFDANNYILEALIDKPQEVVDVDTNAVGEDDFIQENLSEEQTSAYNKYLHRENIFVSGPGGSGKTKLIQCIYKHAKICNKRIQVCALTGCAAILLDCGAKTIHSWGGIGLANEANEIIVEKLFRNKYKRKIWNSVDILVIDEVSMMSMKIFELLDALGKRLRKSTLPFGGIQIIFSGDFYQLPPVGNMNDISTSKFCFESPIWENTFPNVIQLKKIFRQTDKLYIKILNEIRIGKLHRSSYNALMERVGVNPIDEHKPTILLPRRQDVDEINTTQLGAIDDENIEYKFNIADATTIILTKTEQITASQYSTEAKDIEAKYLIKNILCDETIRLKKGAQVMCVANLDPEVSGGICNGSQGIIHDFVNGYPLVHFNNGTKRIIKRHIWKSESIPGVGIEHVPLILSWAITIHKAQGVTLENAYIDVGSGIFEFGQSYVALSRVKSLAGLYLKNFNPQKIKIHPKVNEFYGN